MKNLSKKILVGVFAGFLSLSLLLTGVFHFKGLLGSAYENKELLLQYKTAFSTVSAIFSDNLIFLEDYSNLYGGLQRAQGRNAVWADSAGSAYMIGDDGKIYSASIFGSRGEIDEDGLTKEEREKLDECAEALSRFAKTVTERNADFFFVQAPERYDAEYVTLPVENLSANVLLVDALENQLKEDENIHLLNLQRYFHEQNIPFDEWFYRTDHHWTTKTAFLAYQELCRVINRNTDIQIDEYYFDSANWNVETRENSYLGSLGGKVGSGFVGKDDLDFIFPKFETDYQKTSAKAYNVSIEKGDSIIKQGAYTEAVLDINQSIPEYSSYVGYDVCEVRMTNSKAATDQKVLIIKDSFALPVGAFLSTCFSETRLLDLRFFGDNLLEYLDSYNPDVVIVLYNPSSYKTNFFDFE